MWGRAPGTTWGLLGPGEPEGASVFLPRKGARFLPISTLPRHIALNAWEKKYSSTLGRIDSH